MAASAVAPGTALLVVDIQNDFADPLGSLCVAGGEGILALVNREIAAAVAAGAMVVYSQDWHPDTTPHFQKDGGPWPVRSSSARARAERTAIRPSACVIPCRGPRLVPASRSCFASGGSKRW